ncbi:MAG: hypothetical protein ACRCYO_20175, partial [Bacteroidia bacterium]
GVDAVHTASMPAGAVRAATLRAPQRPSIYVAPLDRRQAFAWWEYESTEKRRFALEALMREMFARR